MWPSGRSASSTHMYVDLQTESILVVFVFDIVSSNSSGIASLSAKFAPAFLPFGLLCLVAVVCRRVKVACV